jgi:hypothetical protein
MQRWGVILVLLATVALGSAMASAAPPRRSPSGYAVRVTYHYRGRTVTRITYPGYVQGFPPPAFLYYGYPQSGFSYGVGF